MAVAILPMLNTLLPALIGLYKETRAQNPGQPALSDAQFIELFGIESGKVVSQAEAWLAAHPKP